MKNINAPINLSDYCLLEVLGSGAGQFLQGQITINIESINPQQALLCAICNVKGRVIALFHIYQIDQGYRLLLPKSIAQLTLDYLKTYSVFYKVTMLIELDHLQVTRSDANPAADPTAQDSSLIGIQHTKLSLQVFTNESQKTHSGIAQVDNQYLWYWQLTEQRICWLSEISSGHFLPHNLNLPSLKAVDFDKGCFTGQEIIARMHYKGKLKQQLMLLEAQIDPSSQPIPIKALSSIQQTDKKVGEVICHIHHPDQGYRFLCLLKKTVNSLQNFLLDQKNHPILRLTE